MKNMDYLRIFANREEFDKEFADGYGQLPTVSIFEDEIGNQDSKPSYIKDTCGSATYYTGTSDLFKDGYNIKSVSIDGKYVFNNTNERTWHDITIDSSNFQADSSGNVTLISEDILFNFTTAPMLEITVDGGITEDDYIGIVWKQGSKYSVFWGFFDKENLKNGTLYLGPMHGADATFDASAITFVVGRDNAPLTTYIRYYSVDDLEKEVILHVDETNTPSLPTGMYIDYVLLEAQRPLKLESDVLWLKNINTNEENYMPVSLLEPLLYDEKTIYYPIMLSLDENYVFCFIEGTVDANGEIIGAGDIIETTLTVKCKESITNAKVTDSGSKTVTFELYNRFCPVLFSGTLVEEFDEGIYTYCNITKLEPTFFSKCPYLKKLVIPRNIETIGHSGCFSSCTSLETLVLPKKLTSIDLGLLSSCSSLKTITCHATTAPNISVSNALPQNVVVNVPKNSDYTSWENNSYIIKYNWTFNYV